MWVVVDASGIVQTIGEAAFSPPPGGQVLETDLAPDAMEKAEQAASGLADLVLDTSGKRHRIVARPRAATAAETERTDRAGLVAQIDAAITAWPTATNAQKLDGVLLCLKGIRALARYTLRGA